MFIAKSSQPDLTLLAELIATGKLKPLIERRYSLSEAAKRFGMLKRGIARGKVIIT